MGMRRAAGVVGAWGKGITMDSHSAMIGPRTAVSALQTLRDAETLAAYIGVCPTCLGWDDPAAATSERTATADRPVCPTCGLCSVEWDVAVAIDGDTPTLRLFALLEVIARKNHFFSLPALIEETGLPKPTLHRMLQQLESAGMIQREADRQDPVSYTHLTLPTNREV